MLVDVRVEGKREVQHERKLDVALDRVEVQRAVRDLIHRARGRGTEHSVDAFARRACEARGEDDAPRTAADRVGHGPVLRVRCARRAIVPAAAGAFAISRVDREAPSALSNKERKRLVHRGAAEAAVCPLHRDERAKPPHEALLRAPVFYAELGGLQAMPERRRAVGIVGRREFDLTNKDLRLHDLVRHIALRDEEAK